MKISRETLVELARDECERRAAGNGLLSGYLIGSVASGDPLLGGTADIDLVLIHETEPAQEREIVRLSDQVHLDITHHGRWLYEEPRALRVDPWMGPALCEPIFLFDPNHFFEWAQAGARGQFYRPDHTYERARAFLKFAQHAHSVLPISSRWVRTFARATLDAANAAACLTTFPAAGRRLTLDLERALFDLGQPELYNRFLALLGATEIDGWDLPAWLSDWGRAFDTALPSQNDPDLDSSRRDYFLSGFQALAEADRPEAAFWTLLTTWELALNALGEGTGNAEFNSVWDRRLTQVRLHTGARVDRARELEDFINDVGTFIEEWAETHGA